MMKRTQLLLDEQIKNDLLFLSQVKNQSMSSLVRELLAEKIKKETRIYKKKINEKGIEAMIRMGERARKLKTTGPKDLARNHDYYLYSTPKTKPSLE